MSPSADVIVSAPPMRVGLMCSRLPGFEHETSIETVQRVRASGFDGVLFPTPRDASSELDEAELREVGAVARELDAYLEFGIGCAGPDRDPRSLAADLGQLLRAGRAAGCTEFFTYTRSDRRAAGWPHREQLAAVEQALRLLVPVLHDLDCQLNLKTHEDLSSAEVLALVEAIGDDHVGVSLDAANVVVRGEDPVAATRRLAPHVRQAHLDDIALFFVHGGLRRKLLPCGTGVLDLPAIVSELAAHGPVRNLTLEQHRGQFDVGIFDAGWFESEPHVTSVEIASLARMAWETESRVSEGRMPSLSALSTEPDAEERMRRFTRSAAYLRRLVDGLRRATDD